MAIKHQPQTDKEIEERNLEIEKINNALPNFCTQIPLWNKDGSRKEKAENEINKMRKNSLPESSPSKLYLSYFK